MKPVLDAQRALEIAPPTWSDARFVATGARAPYFSVLGRAGAASLSPAATADILIKRGRAEEDRPRLEEALVMYERHEREIVARLCARLIELADSGEYVGESIVAYHFTTNRLCLLDAEAIPDLARLALEREALERRGRERVLEVVR